VTGFEFGRKQVHILGAVTCAQAMIRFRALLRDNSHEILNANRHQHGTGSNRSDALLAGLLFDDRGNRMSPSHANKKGVRYNYYVSAPAIQGRKQDSGTVSRVPARAIEEAVTDALRARSGLVKLPDLPEGQSREGLVRDVQRVELRADRILIKMRAGDTACQAIDEEEQSDQADLRPTDDAPIQIPWTPPGSRRRRDIILPVEARRTSSPLRPNLLRSSLCAPTIGAPTIARPPLTHCFPLRNELSLYALAKTSARVFDHLRFPLVSTMSWGPHRFPRSGAG
jgi:hypothetical protein